MRRRRLVVEHGFNELIIEGKKYLLYQSMNGRLEYLKRFEGGNGWVDISIDPILTIVIERLKPRPLSSEEVRTIRLQDYL